MSANNAYHAEVEKFSALAHDWWNPDGAFKTLHAINPLRLRWIEQRTRSSSLNDNSLIAQPLVGKRILDIGCGGGILAEAMAQRGAEVTAIDLSASSIQAAQAHQAHSPTDMHIPVDYRLLSAEELAQQQAAYFDIVTCMELLEHVPSPVHLVSACAKLIKPQGHLFFSTINRTYKAYLFAIIAAEYLLKLLPANTHHYDAFIQPAELATWVRQAGLSVADMAGISYNPLLKHYRISTDVSVNYLMHCRHLPV